MVEHRSPKPGVGGSSPSWPAKRKNGYKMPKIIDESAKYLKEVKAEMSKVTWPTWIELKGSTILVIVLSVFFTIYINMLDLIVTSITRLF
jgi:preprotein translocase subunit SecE